MQATVRADSRPANRTIVFRYAEVEGQRKEMPRKEFSRHDVDSSSLSLSSGLRSYVGARQLSAGTWLASRLNFVLTHFMDCVMSTLRCCRGFLEDSCRMLFYTDTRSAKVDEIAKKPWAEVSRISSSRTCIPDGIVRGPAGGTVTRLLPLLFKSPE